MSSNSNVAISRQEQASAIAERVVMVGDLSKLTAHERVTYYSHVCNSLGLNPLTRPFEYIALQGRLTLYARKDATDQLRKLHKISIKISSREVLDGVYVVTAQATESPSGRQDESTGAVAIVGLKGDLLANAFMKAETKAKRRVTLSIVGLGMLDESEIDSIPGAQPVMVGEDGTIAGAPSPSRSLVAEIEAAPDFETLMQIGARVGNTSLDEVTHRAAKDAWKRRAAQLQGTTVAAPATKRVADRAKRAIQQAPAAPEPRETQSRENVVFEWGDGSEPGEEG